MSRGTRRCSQLATRAELASTVADDSPAVAADDLEALLDLFATITGEDASTSLRLRLTHQVLRSVEIALLADPILTDIALNPGLYLGRETLVLENRLATLLNDEPTTVLIRHLRRLVLSRAGELARKASLDPFDSQVFESYRQVSESLRCLDCGYHFTSSDMGAQRLELVQDLRFTLATEVLARRMRDPWKPPDAHSPERRSRHT